MPSPLHNLIVQESLAQLEAGGFAGLLQALQDPGCCLRNGKVSMTAVRRKLGLSPWQMRRLLENARELLNE